MDVAEKFEENSPLLVANGSRKVNRNWFRNVTVEPVAFLLSFGWSLSEIMLTNQIVYQSCVVTLESNETACSLLKSSGVSDNQTIAIYLEEKVQPYAATISMTIVLLTSVVPALVALFLGPWSDKFGRKPVIAIASVGYMLTEILMVWISYLSSYYALSPWLYVVANIPVAVSGGYSVFNAGIFSYMNDVTNENNRTMRMGVLQGFTMLGVLIGLLASSYMVKFVTVTTMFSISAVIMFISVMYLILVTNESITTNNLHSAIQQLKAIFNVNLVVDMLQTFSKPRPNYERAITWLLIIVGGFVEFAVAGRTLFFLYTRRQFCWDAVSYGFWLSAELGLIMLGNLFGIALLKKLFNIPDLGLLALSTVNQVGDYLVKGFARQGWQLYLTTFMTSFKGVDGAAVRSILSSILPSDEIGKSYSMDLSVKAITPLISVFFFTYIYNRTIDNVPSTYLFVTSAIFGINLLLIGVTQYLLNKRNQSIIKL
ncbi:probable peptidoglycan muropeptide transporter SLC46 [Ochlerotatus camptorhynchus]|uniref:probable peptidoglycan muropeptide transporter SLC46 n=1 Tax=Ochlerotatus camptorhynchus TaxID=644619 RepID=UPI0031DAADC1